MKKVVVYSNIIFRALQYRQPAVREILLNAEHYFYSPNFLFVEIFKHKERIVKSSKAGDDLVIELLEKVVHNINFINEEFISTANMIHAYRLCSGVDEKDTVFIALTLELDGLLWTFDEALKSGLRSKGFDRFIDL
jgi:predicted nucleic acid-binding protein